MTGGSVGPPEYELKKLERTCVNENLKKKSHIVFVTTLFSHNPKRKGRHYHWIGMCLGTK